MCDGGDCGSNQAHTRECRMCLRRIRALRSLCLFIFRPFLFYGSSHIYTPQRRVYMRRLGNVPIYPSSSSALFDFVSADEYQFAITFTTNSSVSFVVEEYIFPLICNIRFGICDSFCNAVDNLVKLGIA